MNEHENEIGDDKDKKFLLWHMILLDILNIKMSDLKLDFNKGKSNSVEEAIKKHLLSEKAVKRRNDFINTKIMSDHPEGLLWEYSQQVFPEFENVQVKFGNMWANTNINVGTAELLERIFACFFKVSFCQMKKASGKEWHKNKIIKFRDYFFQSILAENGILRNYWECLATYLFKIGELDQLFLDNEDENDFFDYFCIFCDKTCNYNYYSYNFSELCFYLNKIKPLEIRYTDDRNKFWQIFFLSKVTEYKVTDTWFVNITAYFSDKKLIKSIKAYINNKRIKVDSFFYSSILFKKNRQKVISDDNQKNYFNPIIIRFCGQKNLTNKVIQSISKVIKDKNGVEHEDENKISDKNKIGFWQHFLFGLFFILTCLSLLFCFKISLLYFILLFVICFAPEKQIRVPES